MFFKTFRLDRLLRGPLDATETCRDSAGGSLNKLNTIANLYVSNRTNKSRAGD